jgi:hypothetical protein
MNNRWERRKGKGMGDRSEEWERNRIRVIIYTSTKHNNLTSNNQQPNVKQSTTGYAPNINRYSSKHQTSTNIDSNTHRYWDPT